MILKVNKDICEIKQNEVWNVGDYNVHTVQVELSEEFDGLVNKVRFFVEDNSYDMLITDNVAEVPREATLTEGIIRIGVYGYDADTDILVQSTSPVNKYIASGTYTGEADNTEPLTPTDKQQMETAIQKNTDDIIDLKENKQDKLISGVNIKTINNESILSGGNITLVEEETDPIFTNSPAYSITDNDITYWNNKANISDIPDVSNFITNTVDDLVNYYKKSETFTKQEVNNLIATITTLDIQVVQTLPVQDISTTTIYLVPKTTAETNDAYDEYIYVSNAWEHIGSTEVDLTNYVTNTDYATASVGGVLKVSNGDYGITVDEGVLKGTVRTYAQYNNMSSKGLVCKGTFENVITGKELATSTDLASKQNITDNTLTTTNKTIPTAINEVNSIAKGANQAVGYNNYQTMITAINAMDDNEYNVGQNVYIVTVNVPDLWVSSVESTSSTYTYVDDATVVNDLETNGYIQVGYYKLSMLETQKVDLTNYVTNTDYAGSNKAGVIRTNPDYGTSITSVGALISATKTYRQYQDTTTNNMFISKGTLENVITGKGLVSNTDYATSQKAGVIKCFNSDGLTTNNGTLITAKKTYAQYNSSGDWLFVGKGTLENVITGKGLDLKQLSTFDATKTQVLKNINGTLTWVDE